MKALVNELENFEIRLGVPVEPVSFLISRPEPIWLTKQRRGREPRLWSVDECQSSNP